MKIKYLVAASAVALFTSGAARAADVVYAPTAAPAEPVATSGAVPIEMFSWDGIYIGASGGATWIQNQFDVANEKFLVKPQGYVGGVYGGSNYDLGGDLIAGIESDFAWSSVETSQKIANIEYNTTQKWVGSTRARIGYAFDSFLPYVAAGLSYSQVDVNVSNNLDKDDFHDIRFGWTAGAGVDYALTDNFLLRAEYKYNNLLEKNIALSKVASPVNPQHTLDAGDVRFGVAYKF